MAKAKYDPRLDRLAAALNRDEESPHGWSFRAQEAISFGPGHLLMMWWTDQHFCASPAEIDVMRIAWGVRIALRREDDDKLIYLLRVSFDLIIARLEIRIREGAVPQSFDEFAEFIGLRHGQEIVHAH